MIGNTSSGFSITASGGGPDGLKAMIQGFLDDLTGMVSRLSGSALLLLAVVLAWLSGGD